MKSVNGLSNGYIEEDIDDETPSSLSSSENISIINDKKIELMKDSDDKSANNITLENNYETNQNKDEDAKQDQEFIFIHDTGFNVQIAAPGLEPFEIQVILIFVEPKCEAFLLNQISNNKNL
jgi:hypothetical protein